MLMDRLLNTLKRFKAIIQPNILFPEVMKNDKLRELIINLNTGGPRNALPTSQLWRGIDSKGRRLEDIGGGNPVTGTYSPSTIEGIPGVFKGKREMGLPFDRITLYNDGIFYRSFRVSVKTFGNGASIIIEADPNRGNTNLLDDWGDDIIGLTPENVDIVSREFIDYALNFIRGELAKV